MEGMDKDSPYFHAQQTSVKLATRAEALNIIEQTKCQSLLQKIEKRERTLVRKSDSLIDGLKDKLQKMRAYRQVLNTRYSADNLAALTSDASAALGDQAREMSPERRYTGAVILKRGFSMELLRDDVADVIRTDFDRTAKKQQQLAELLLKSRKECENALGRTQRTGIFKGTPVRLPPVRVPASDFAPTTGFEVNVMRENGVDVTFLTNRDAV